jgi:hypothetical protein
MGAIGMVDARVRGENADWSFPDAAAMIKWIDQPSLVPFLAHVSEGRNRVSGILSSRE